MIEARGLPCTGVVAHLASLCESARHVVWIRRTLEILQVARHAGCARQVVIVVHVAIGTLPWRNRMRSRKGEVDQRVVERCGLPRRRRVALSAIRREVRYHVIRIRGALEILQVTANTSRARQVVIVVDVTIGTLAGRNRVSPAKRESD